MTTAVTLRRDNNQLYSWEITVFLSENENVLASELRVIDRKLKETFVHLCDVTCTHDDHGTRNVPK